MTIFFYIFLSFQPSKVCSDCYSASLCNVSVLFSRQHPLKCSYEEIMMLLAKSPNTKFSMAISISVFFHVVVLCALRLVRKPSWMQKRRSCFVLLVRFCYKRVMAPIAWCSESIAASHSSCWRLSRSKSILSTVWLMCLTSDLFMTQISFNSVCLFLKEVH